MLKGTLYIPVVNTTDIDMTYDGHNIKKNGNFNNEEMLPIPCEVEERGFECLNTNYVEKLIVNVITAGGDPDAIEEFKQWALDSKRILDTKGLGSQLIFNTLPMQNIILAVGANKFKLDNAKMLKCDLDSKTGVFKTILYSVNTKIIK